MHVHVRRAVRAAAVLVATAALSRVGRAQAPTAADSLPFARGQWGLQVTGGGPGFVSVGALRFTSPRAAWLLDLSGRVSRSEMRYESNQGAPFPPSPDLSEVISSAGIELRAGRRHYRSLGRGVASFASVGVSGGYSGARSSISSTSRMTSFSGGLFGDLGATYFVTPHLGLGASAALEALYSTARSRSFSGTSRTSSVGVELQRPTVLVTLFF